MPKISSLTKPSSIVKFDYEGEQFELQYSPSRYTPAFEATLAESEGDRWQSGFLVQFLVGLLTGWNVEDDKGRTLKISIDTLNHLPVEFLSAAVVAINEDSQPGEAGGSLSDG